MDCADPVLFLGGGGMRGWGWGWGWGWGSTAAVLSRADTGGEEAITVVLALTKTLHLQGEEEITPQWCLTLLPHSGSWALGPRNRHTTNAQTTQYRSAAVTHKERDAPAFTTTAAARVCWVKSLVSPVGVRTVCIVWTLEKNFFSFEQRSTSQSRHRNTHSYLSFKPGWMVDLWPPFASLKNFYGKFCNFVIWLVFPNFSFSFSRGFSLNYSCGLAVIIYLYCRYFR